MQGLISFKTADLILAIQGYNSTGNIYTTIYSKIDSQWGFAVWLRNIKLGLCKSLEGLDGMGDEREI